MTRPTPQQSERIKIKPIKLKYNALKRKICTRIFASIYTNNFAARTVGTQR